MKIVLCIFILILSSISFGKAKSRTLPKLETSKMNIHHISMLRDAMVDFYISLDKTNHKLKDKQVHYIFRNLKYLLNDAYAAEDSCFFGGWPSAMEGTICKAPWTHGNQNWGAGVECSEGKDCATLINTKYQACGSPTKFRCSPLLFGADESGSGKCIDTGGTYYGLTAKCVQDEEIKANTPQVATFLKENPNLLQQMVGEASIFCEKYTKEDPDYDHNKTCEALENRLNYILQTMNSDELVERDVASERSREANKALGFLDQCQKKYNKDNEAWWDLISKRDSLSQIKNSAICAHEDPNLAEEEFEQLYKTVNQIDENVLPKRMLNESLKDGLELTLKNLLITNYQFTGQHDINLLRNFKEDYPHLSKNDFDEIFTKAARDVDSALKENKLQQIDKESVKTTINEFGSKVRAACLEINKNYTDRTRLAEGSEGHIYRSGRFNPIDNDSEKEYYQSAQKTINEIYHNFQTEDARELKGRFLTTEYFRDNIFPFNANLAKKCARGDIQNEAFINVNDSDIEKGLASYQEMMKDDLDDLNDMAKNSDSSDTDDIQDSLQDLIKYKPYLVGQFLKEQRQDPDTQMAYAKYLCREAVDIYNGDEWFRVGEITIGAAGLAASGFLIATGVGSPVGAATGTASAGLLAGTAAVLTTKTAGALIVGSELYMAKTKFDDANNTQRGASLSLTTTAGSQNPNVNATSVDQYSRTSAFAENTANEAKVDAGLAGLQVAAGTFKVVNLARRSKKAADVGVESGTALQTSSKVSDDIAESASDLGSKPTNRVNLLEGPNKRSTSSSSSGAADRAKPNSNPEPNSRSRIEDNSNSNKSGGTNESSSKPQTEPSNTQTRIESGKSSPENIGSFSLKEAQENLKKVSGIKKLPSEVIPKNFHSGKLREAEALRYLRNILGKTGDISKKDVRALISKFHDDKLKQAGYNHQELFQEVKHLNLMYSAAKKALK